jgi:hypothetical protein
LKVCSPLPPSTMAKSVPVVPTAKVCAAVVSEFIEVIAEPPDESMRSLWVTGSANNRTGVEPSH